MELCAGQMIPWNFSDSNISNGHFILSSASNQIFYLKWKGILLLINKWIANLQIIYFIDNKDSPGENRTTKRAVVDIIQK